MKKTFSLLDSVVLKTLDMIAYIFSGRFPEKIPALELSKESNEMENLAKSQLSLDRADYKEMSSLTKPSHNSMQTHSETPYHFPEKIDHSGAPSKSETEPRLLPRLERKHLTSPRKARSRYTNIQRNKLLLPESRSLNPEHVCTYLSEARISDLLNIPGFSPELVARIYDARRQKKFTSVKEIEDRVEGFMGSHLSELQIVMSHQK